MQIINPDRSYNQQAFLNVTQQLTLQPTSKDYLVVSIIGTQSSGKSTLLNHLFRTGFKVMSGVPGTRTTSGVWASIDYQEPIVILDCEGNDSVDRASESDFSFQKSVSAYSLSLSDLLIVNVWTSQVGTYDGCQYRTITMLMEQSLRVFKQDSIKTILFCLRDFDPEADNYQNMQKQILTDIKSMWNGIQKPEKYAKHTYDRFFNVVVHPLFKYQITDHKKFDEDVTKLRVKLVDKKLKDYVFRFVNTKFNLPLKELPVVSKSVWNATLNNKDINVPGFKIQLSNIRCEDIKNQQIKSFTEAIGQLESPSRKELSCLETGNRLDKLFRQSVNGYISKSQYYDKKIAKEREDQLRKNAIGIIEQFNESLVKQLKEREVTEFRMTDIKVLSKTVTMSSQVEALFEGAVKRLQNKIKALRYSFPSKNQVLLSFEKQLKVLCNQLKQQTFEDAQHSIQASLDRKLDEHVVEITDKLDTSFWDRALVELKTASVQYRKQIMDAYEWVFGSVIPSRYLRIHQASLWESIKTLIRNRLELSVVEKMTRKFDGIFLRSNEGLAGKVLTFGKKQFQQLFKQARTSTLHLFKYLNTIPPSAQKEAIAVSEDLFQPQKYESLLDQIQKTITAKYQKTMRKETERKMNKVPIILWIILFIFSFGQIRMALRLLSKI